MPGLAESPSTSVDRTIAILEAVASRAAGMSNAEISRKLGIPKSSASYILRALEKHGYLRRQRETGKYRLGLKILNLGRGALSGVDVREVALPIMRQLVEHVHITSHLAILDGSQAVYVERVESPGSSRWTPGSGGAWRCIRPAWARRWRRTCRRRRCSPSCMSGE